MKVYVIGSQNLLEKVITFENYQKVKYITLITYDDNGVDMWLRANGFD